jgi:hypothetical protein
MSFLKRSDLNVPVKEILEKTGDDIAMALEIAAAYGYQLACSDHANPAILPTSDEPPSLAGPLAGLSDRPALHLARSTTSQPSGPAAAGA